MRWVQALSLCSIVAGIAVRIYQFGSMPPGLNQDEASIGFDASSLFHYGTDGNGVSWPVHLISFGSGGNASYAYMVVPFMAFGLSPFTLRLPMLITGIASLFLVWFVARRLFGDRAAWGTAAVVALSPWHVMLSKWALDCNALPFLFLCGLALLAVSIEAERKLMWLSAACAMFGVSVYSYGAAYLAVPLFVLSALLTLTIGRIFTVRQAAAGALVLGITALPIGLYVAVNLFRWNSIHLGAITVPRLPTTPRFESQLSSGPLAHVGEFLRLLITQSDGSSYNVTDPYGFLYSGVFVALAVALVVAIPVLVIRRRRPLPWILLSLWVAVSVPTGILQEPNINRVNLLIMGLAVATGVALAVIDQWLRGILVLGLVAFLGMFGFFTRDYFTSQRERIAVGFFEGLLPALSYAQKKTTKESPICVTDRVNMPHIFALFSETPAPRDYLATVRYVDPTAAFRRVSSYGRYTFGLERCPLDQAQVVIARVGEPVTGRFAKEQSFKLFELYVPIEKVGAR